MDPSSGLLPGPLRLLRKTARAPNESANKDHVAGSGIAVTATGVKRLLQTTGNYRRRWLRWLTSQVVLLCDALPIEAESKGLSKLERDEPFEVRGLASCLLSGMHRKEPCLLVEKGLGGRVQRTALKLERLSVGRVWHLQFERSQNTCALGGREIRTLGFQCFAERRQSLGKAASEVIFD